MASKRAIQTALSTIRANYGKYPQWADEVSETWFDGLRQFADCEVLDAVKYWRNAEAKAPTVANIRNLVRGNTAEPEKPIGCRRCTGTGWVEIAHHTAGKKGQTSTVKTYVAGCDCPAGQRLCRGPVEEWEAFVDRLRGDPYTLRVYYSTPDHPFLSPAERTDRETLERLSPALVDKRLPGEWNRVKPKATTDGL